MRRNLIAEGNPLWADEYHWTMSYGWFKNNMHNDFKISGAFFRKNSPNCGYIVSAGLGEVLEWLDNWHLGKDDIDWLRSKKNSAGGRLFSDDFVNFVKNAKLAVNVKAVPEGELVFANEPLYSISGPCWQVEIVEAALLNVINSQFPVATKASRVVLAAGADGIDRRVMEFGLRRDMELGGYSAARAAFIGGCAATSNPSAARDYGIPSSGTMAHSWVMSFEDETEAFKAFLRTYPHDGILLPDTYETRQGIKNAVRASNETGIPLKGIRIDSGDLAYWSKEARKILDESGKRDTQIIASNDLDEFLIENLVVVQKAAFDCFALGTKLVRADDMGALGAVYKTKSYLGKDKIKVAQGKTTIPGATNVLRTMKNGNYAGDVIVREGSNSLKNGKLTEAIASYHLQSETQSLRKFEKGMSGYWLLQDVVVDGKIDTGHKERSLWDIQKAVKENLQRLDAECRRLCNPHVYGVGITAELRRKQQELIQAYQHKYGR